MIDSRRIRFPVGLFGEQIKINFVLSTIPDNIPETSSWMLDHVAAAGFSRPETILQEEFFDGWTFTKA